MKLHLALLFTVAAATFAPLPATAGWDEFRVVQVVDNLGCGVIAFHFLVLHRRLEHWTYIYVEL